MWLSIPGSGGVLAHRKDMVRGFPRAGRGALRDRYSVWFRAVSARYQPVWLNDVWHGCRVVLPCAAGGDAERARYVEGQALRLRRGAGVRDPDVAWTASRPGLPTGGTRGFISPAWRGHTHRLLRDALLMSKRDGSAAQAWLHENEVNLAL